MKIDISRVNLTERDIEDYLFANPNQINDPHRGTLVRWVGRQYKLPFGIADLIGIRDDNTLVVVEIKNVPINKAAITQVCRYAYDLKHIVSTRLGYPIHDSDGGPYIERLLVGPSIDDQTFGEAVACDVKVMLFSIQLKLDISKITWGHEYHEEIEEKYRSISRDEIFNIYGEHLDDHFQRLADEQERLSVLDFAIGDVIEPIAIAPALLDNVDSREE